MYNNFCFQITFLFAENKSRPAYALTSFPGSGVTWTRQLIEGLTGIFTGTVYGSEEPGIIDGNYYGNNVEPNCGCLILIKDHEYPEFYPLLGDVGPYQHRGILILRNPFDALFTFAHYLWSGNNQIGTVSLENFSSLKWDHYIKFVAFEWAEHAVRWIQHIENGTVVFYERLLQDTERELKGLLHAINFIDPDHPPFDPERMRCTLLHKNRLDRKRKQKPTVLLTEENHSRIMYSILRVQESLQKKGWPLLPLHLYQIPKYIGS
ncbi:WSCD family member CG9164 [Daphnia magna]|uniref:WSCD family member CG9164 n=1 Tax=Daphnia magna TaxID=35525 RepID=UPI001E1BAAD8|nr:WSCD family member CG9164 [Daphnia magna]